MGSMVAGHVIPGIGFYLISLWYLFNHIKLHALNPSYTALPWLPPASEFRYSEPFSIMAGPVTSILTELFISPTTNNHWTLMAPSLLPTSATLSSPPSP